MAISHVRPWTLGAAFALLSALPLPSPAQGFPNKPIRLISTFAAGSTVDIVARSISEPMAQSLGQPVVVEDKAGAGGNIAIDFVAKAPKDGYTVVIGTSGSLAINPAVKKAMPYDPIADLAPVSLVANVPNILVAGPSVSGTTLKQIIDDAKAHPGKIFFASSGVGSVNHLLGEVLQSRAGIQLVHTPYKGNQDPIADLMAGRVQLLFSGLPPIQSLVSSGKLKAIAVAGKTRLPSIASTPTMAEAGLPGVEAVAMFSLVAPAGTPQEAITKLNTAVVAALANAEVKARLSSLGAQPESSTPQELGRLMKEDLRYWTKVTSDLNLKLD